MAGLYVRRAKLNSIVNLFKQFGRADRPDEMIIRYLEVRGAERGLSELEDSHSATGSTTSTSGSPSKPRPRNLGGAPTL